MTHSHLNALKDTAIHSPDEVSVNITITDSRGFVHHYGEILTDSASARAALDALSRPSNRDEAP